MRHSVFNIPTLVIRPKPSDFCDPRAKVLPFEVGVSLLPFRLFTGHGCTVISAAVQRVGYVFDIIQIVGRCENIVQSVDLAGKRSADIIQVDISHSFPLFAGHSCDSSSMASIAGLYPEKGLVYEIFNW